MSVLDNLLGGNAAGLINRVLGAAQTAQANTGVNTSQVLQSLVSLIEHPSTGGLSGLLQTLEAAGLGREVSSWVSTGANLPVSADQVRSALGDSRLQEIAARLGNPREAREVAEACAANLIAVLIPCQRVVKKDGSLSCYRWGFKRKRELLARERNAALEPT